MSMTPEQQLILNEVKHLRSETNLQFKDMRESTGRCLKQIKGDMAEVKHFINGNGEPGAKVRLDRLEQKDKASSRYSFLAFGGVITVIIKEALQYIGIVSK